MKEILSIGIPTYNRASQLRNQLQSLFKQDLSLVKEIIVVDNNSDYDIKELVKEFHSDKIRLVINPFNVMMSTNMVNPFLYCKTDWLWLISDDDETLASSINLIISMIKRVKDSTGMIKFSLTQKENPSKLHEVGSLEDFIDYYFYDKNFNRGELVFMSNAVYNTKNINPFLGYMFEYSYTYIAYLVPVFIGLNQRIISVAFSNEQIVKYLPPKDGGWQVSRVGLGLSNLSHIPINLSNKYYKRFLNITMTVTHSILFKNLFVHYEPIKSKKAFRLIYNNIYSYYLSCSEKIIAKLFLITLGNSWFVRLLKRINKLAK